MLVQQLGCKISIRLSSSLRFLRLVLLLLLLGAGILPFAGSRPSVVEVVVAATRGTTHVVPPVPSKVRGEGWSFYRSVTG